MLYTSEKKQMAGYNKNCDMRLYSHHTEHADLKKNIKTYQ